MARQEHSAGIVVFHGRPRQYLLLHYPSGHWDFAKGHVEAGESDLEAALREVEEETGIRKVHVRPGFLHKFEYFYKRGEGTVHKSVTYFVGRAATRRVRVSHEHQGFIWLPFDKAVRRITYPNARELLKRADEFLEAPGAGPPVKTSPQGPSEKKP